MRHRRRRDHRGDLSDRGYLALRLRDDPTPPTILAAGPPLTTGGHCHFLDGEADEVDGVRSAVREYAERGVDVIKIMAGGGNMTPGRDLGGSQYGPDELRAVVGETTRRIRVGAGGVLLPNHAPIVVAEQSGTLAAFHPGRIDLSLGRSRAAADLVRGEAERTAGPFPARLAVGQ